MEKEILKMEYYVPKSANNSYLCKIIIVKCKMTINIFCYGY